MKKRHKDTKAKKRRVRCTEEGCGKMFGNKGARGKHYMAAHYKPYTPPPPPPREFKSFADLVRNAGWGKNYTEQERKSPPDNDLIIGYLACILEELRQIKKEAERKRTIS